MSTLIIFAFIFTTIISDVIAVDHETFGQFSHKEAQEAQNQQHLFELFVPLCG